MSQPESQSQLDQSHPPTDRTTTPASVDNDAHHLHLLSVFHYVVGGIELLLAFCPIGHLIMGLIFLFGPADQFNDANQGQPMPELMQRVFGLMFTLFPLVMMIAGWTLGALTLYAGRCLAHRRRYTFCLVLAGIQCAFMPFGTVLGVFTLVVLLRPGVKERFAVATAT